MGILSKAGVVGAAVSFARSERGQRLLAQARDRFDTPANRAKAQEAFRQASSFAREQASRRRSA